MKISYVKQTDLKDCGVSCLMSIINYYGGYVRREYLRELTKTTEKGVSVYSLVEAANKLGFESKAVKGDIINIKNKTPFIAHLLINNKIGHFVVVKEISNNYIYIMDPSCGFKKYLLEEWNKISTNIYILYNPIRQILKQKQEEKFLNMIYHFFKKYKLLFLILIIFSFIYTISSIILSYTFQFFLEKDNIKIKYIFLILSCILLIKEIINLLRNNLINYINHNLDKSLFKKVYNHLIRLPYIYFKSREKGDVITRIQDVFKIRDFITKLFVTFAIDIVFIIVCLIFLFKINYQLCIIILISTLLYLVIVFLLNKIVIKKIKKIKEEESNVQNHLIESLSSIETIKNMQIENYLFDKLLLKYNKLQDNSYSFNKIYNIEIFLREIIIGITTLIVIYFGILSVYNNNFSFMKLLVFYTLMNYYYSPIANICDLHLLYLDSKIAFLRIKELLNVEEEDASLKQEANDDFKGEIRIHNLDYSYNGINSVIRCNNLIINNKDKVMVYGESGTGKSTLMKIIVSYLNNYHGKIIINNKELKSYNLYYLRSKITYLSQDEMLYNDTIYNNIVLNKNISYGKYLEIIKITGVYKIIQNKYLKDEMLLEGNGSNLSGGEKQKILLARSLVKESDIYIYDESFSAIDIKSERIILKNLFKYLQDKTIIIISHRLNNKDLYKKFITVKNGKILKC